MKRIFVAGLVVLMMTTGCVFGKSLIGYVDKGKLLDELPEAKIVEEKLKSAQEDRQEKIEIEKEKIKTMQEEFKAKMEKLKLSKEEETVKTRNFIERDMKPKVDALKQKHNTYMMELQTIEKKYLNDLKSKIDTAIEKVGKRRGMDMILDKAAVFHGGIDVTDDVLKELKK